MCHDDAPLDVTTSTSSTVTTVKANSIYHHEQLSLQSVQNDEFNTTTRQQSCISSTTLTLMMSPLSHERR
jgi:hypothetical protein